MRINKLSINYAKTKFMLISPSKKSQNLELKLKESYKKDQ